MTTDRTASCGTWLWALSLFTFASGASAARDDAIIEVDALHPYILAKSDTAASASSNTACGEIHAALLDATGNELVALVQQADIVCISNLQWATDPALQIAVSREANVIAIGNGIPGVMRNYDGTFRDGIKTLFNFLRMVKDIHYWCLTRRTCEGDEWDSVDTYSIDPGSPAYVAVKGAIDSFVDHALLLARRDQHGDNLWEVLSTINDYDMQELYLHVVGQWLNAWDDRYASRSIFQDAMYRLLGVVYRGHRRTDAFGPVFGEDRDLIDAFRDFVLDERRLNTNSHWIMDRSAIELGRYSKYRGTSNYDYVVPIVESVLATYGNNASGNSIRLRLIAEIDYNDGDRCARYGLCDWYAGDGFNANFREALFVQKLECPANACSADTITVHAEDLGQGKLALACRRLEHHGRVFHSMVDTDCEPVPGDANRHLEVFVFNDGRSCEDLESAAFGRNPDSCSGIYWEGDWEGDPSNPETRARFVATEYTADENPRDPELAIWNFEHEYGHYLDGRYNRHGPYRGSDPSINWWSEGFAEYFAAEVSPHIRLPVFQSPYSLSDTLLHSGSIPTRYAHRHLAVRYLMQNRRDFIETLLRYMRLGEYGKYTRHMADEAPKYEAAWRTWLSSRGAVQALNRVRGVTVTPGAVKLTVSWASVFGATGYKVQWKWDDGDFDTGAQRIIGGGKTTSQAISGLLAGTEYTVRVVATRNGLEDGPPSDPAKGTPTPATAELSARGDSIRIDLPPLFGATGEGWTYRATSNAPALATATLNGTTLVIAANEQGESGVATVTVTATDPSGSTRQQVIVVTIEPGASTWLRGWRRAVLEKHRGEGG